MRYVGYAVPIDCALGLLMTDLVHHLLGDRAAASPPLLAGDAVLDRFLAWVEQQGLQLYPAQEEALLAIVAEQHVFVSTPTGSGKSLLALAAHALAIATQRRSVYTAPIKALVQEKFFAWCRVLGAERVGMMTGDATINAGAPVLCCTAEILAQRALAEGEHAAVDFAIMDEFHYYDDRDRGVWWQLPLLALPHCCFVLMSATMGDIRGIAQHLESLSGRSATWVREAQRPVPLRFTYRETPLLESVREVLEANQAPLYLVHFSQRAATERAQQMTTLQLLSRDERQALEARLKGMRFDTPFGKDLRRFLRHGVGVHHAGLLPKYRLLVEELAQEAKLKVICGTDTLGVGVNVPIRSVLFTQLCKYDGEKTKVLSVREFQQIAGRAGRRGYDQEGFVFAQAPEHVVENLALERKLRGADPKKRRKAVFKKPPERGYAHWERSTFVRLGSAEPERLSSRFRVTPGMVLAVSAQQSCREAKALLRRVHEPPPRQQRHRKVAMEMVRSLVEADVLHFEPGALRLRESLPADFSLNQTLGLFAVEALGSFDRSDPLYALQAVSLIEAILEDPTPVLLRQRDTLRDRLFRQLKAQDIEFEERQRLLDEVDYPKPDAEVLEAMLEPFVAAHPWARGAELSPKSVVRDMFEQGESFVGFIRSYGLQRVEGSLLRYLVDAYKTLTRTLPDEASTPELDELIDWLRITIATVDASLLEAWHRLQRLESGDAQALDDDAAPAVARLGEHDLRILLRNLAWRLVQALGRHRHGHVMDILRELTPDSEEARQAVADPLDGAGEPWSADRLASCMQNDAGEAAALRTDPSARLAEYGTFQRQDDSWLHTQQLLGLDGDTVGTFTLAADAVAAEREGKLAVAMLELTLS